MNATYTPKLNDRVVLTKDIIRHGKVVIPTGTKGIVTKAIRFAGPFSLTVAVMFEGEDCADDFGDRWEGYIAKAE